MAVKIATKAELIKLNRTAASKNYNRVIRDDVIAAAADSDRFVISPIIIHEHAAGKLVPPHLRCSVKGDIFAGHFVMLDVQFEDYDQLTQAEETREEQKC